MKNVFIIAHRGASYSSPENTIPAFNLAFEENADFIEGDFYLTKDNIIVCIHDSNTRRVTGKKSRLKINSTNLIDLKKLDVGEWKSEEFRGTKIPTLNEVLDIIPEGKGLYLEIKDDREIFVERLIETLDDYGNRNKQYFSEREIRVIAFSSKTVKLIKKFLPEIKVYLLFSWYYLNRKHLFSVAKKRLLQAIKKLNCDGVNVRFVPFIDKEFVDYLHTKGMDFCVYDVDDSKKAIHLVNLGVDSITTNYPLKIVNAIRNIES